MDVNEVLDDLVAEQSALDAIIARLPPDEWALATPSPRWSVADQIAHLAFFDDTAALAIADPDAFEVHRGEILDRLGDDLAADEATLGRYRAMAASKLLEEWRQARGRLESAARTLTDDSRVEWYGPSMGAKSFLTARLMEAWAHGQDVADTVGATPEPTDRLRHVVQLGVITRGWSYLIRGLDVPAGEVRVELASPSGATWTWGPDDAGALISGPAEDFCLVVTQRRHVDDTELVLEGDAARDWMLKAQAFAGGPSDGPAAHHGDSS